MKFYCETNEKIGDKIVELDKPDIKLFQCQRKPCLTLSSLSLILLIHKTETVSVYVLEK